MKSAEIETAELLQEAARSAGEEQKREFTTPQRLSDDKLDAYFSQESVTLIGFGSLLSEVSSRGTFPDLCNFREVRVQGYMRIFQHPAFIFFERGIADLEAHTYSSLSTEKDSTKSYVAVAFEISGQSKADWLRREEEFHFDLVGYEQPGGTRGVGLACVGSEDDSVYIERWGRDKYQSSLSKHNLRCIWDRQYHRSILPCSVYLRHCVLAAQRRSFSCLASFLDDTYLADRVTTIRQYLDAHPEVMLTQPPPILIGRYSG